MRVDFIEAETKSNKIKILLIIIIAIEFIAIFSMLGIHYAKLYNNNLSKKREKREKIENSYLNNKANDNSIKLENKEEQEKNNIDDRENVKLALLPVYSENAKNEMKKIYNTKTKIVYLTFDDGPSQAVTPLILDLLKEENIKATFFVLGTNVEKNPDIVKRAYLEGHYIANHGYSHNYSKLYSNAEKVLAEYKKTEKCIQNAIDNENYNSFIFRFPGGYTGGKYANIKKQAGKLLNENNICYIDWNNLTGDAEGANTKEKILENIEKYSKDKGNMVVLMHDASNKILTYETLGDVIKFLRDEGYIFENFYNIMK